MMIEEPRWRWRIAKEQAVAFGREADDGFWIREGSTAMREGSPEKKRDRPTRDRLVHEGVLVPDENPALFRFARDHKFSSKSSAAGVVIDGNSNGSHWQLDTATSQDGQKTVLSRTEIEAAMDAYDAYRATGEHSDVFGAFAEPKDYWVRSTRQRPERLYPSKPINFWVNGNKASSGGWGGPNYSAASLHNAGFIITDQGDAPVVPPEKEFVSKSAERIRLVASNYFVAPAREQGLATVSIRASDLAKCMGLENAYPNICQALGGEMFQKLAHVPPPSIVGANPSSTTVFTYTLKESQAVTDITITDAKPATNLILYGPPGTGKTYRSAWEAVRLCLGEAATADLAAPGRRQALMSEYRRLIAEGRIEFVTFHQSTSYEEFVEGLRPETAAMTESGEAGAGFSLAVHDGVFKQISDRARLDHGESEDADLLDRDKRVFKIALGLRHVQEDRIQFGLDNGILHIGWGGDIDWSDKRFQNFDEIAAEWRKRDPEASGNDGNIVVTYSFRADMQIGDYVVLSDGRDSIRAIGEVEGEYYYDAEATYHPHRRHVKWLWRDDTGVERRRFYPKAFRRHSVYKLDQGQIDWDALDELAFSARDEIGKASRDYVLIIDEINRANISKVFGELITLLEADKRMGATNEIRLTLPYSKKSFGVPANLHIVGTMNTADRSIALLDTALRRRFEFRELMPDPQVLPEVVDGVRLRAFFHAMNERIEYLFDREHQIGHAYFSSCETKDDVASVIRDKVIPLLAEYFYEDWSRVALVLGDTSGMSRFLMREEIKAPPGMAQEGMAESKYRWRVRADAFDLEGL